jgi:hypothetical protein
MARRRTGGIQRLNQLFDIWLRQYDTPALSNEAEHLPLRRDMVTLLTFVRDNKVVGTQRTGNMPLKAIRQVTADFVNPPQLDMTIGDKTYKVKSETEVWPLYYLHVLAEIGYLLECAPARRWQLTAGGSAFLNNPPLIQVVYLFLVWWHQVNWLVAYPFGGMGEALPPDFNKLTRDHLLDTGGAGQPVSFEQFADGLIEKTGLVWTARDSTFARMSLHSAIERMVIQILVTFGGVTGTYIQKPLGRETIENLDTFTLTPLGEALLTAAAMM